VIRYVDQYKLQGAEKGARLIRMKNYGRKLEFCEAVTARCLYRV
jgi:hypothetical protein